MSSSSRSANTSNTYQVDRRVVVGEGAINAQDGSFVSVQSLDPATVAAALGFGDRALSGALDFGSGALSGSFGFGRDALSLVDSALNGSLSFGSGVLADSFDFGGQSLAFADAAGRRADTASANAYSNAAAVAENSLNKAYQFGGDALDRAFSNFTATQNLVADAYSDAKGRGALTDKILIGAVIAMAVVAFAAVQK